MRMRLLCTFQRTRFSRLFSASGRALGGRWCSRWFWTSLFLNWCVLSSRGCWLLHLLLLLLLARCWLLRCLCIVCTCSWWLPGVLRWIFFGRSFLRGRCVWGTCRARVWGTLRGNCARGRWCSWGTRASPWLILGWSLLRVRGPSPPAKLLGSC